jgi:hypothetical protein
MDLVDNKHEKRLLNVVSTTSQPILSLAGSSLYLKWHIMRLRTSRAQAADLGGAYKPYSRSLYPSGHLILDPRLISTIWLIVSGLSEVYLLLH